MNPVRIQRVTAEAAPEDATRAARITRRAVELLGRQLACGNVVAPRAKLTLDITMQPGMSDEQMARNIARQLAGKLQ